MADSGTPPHLHANRRVIQVHCTEHGGARNFTNLVMRRYNGHIELDPHVTGGCVIVLDEDAATRVLETLKEWLG